MNLQQFISALSETIINPFIFLVFGVALLYFVWGILKYVRNAESGDKKESRDAIMWGIIGMVIMVGVFGIWRIVLGTFGIGDQPFDSIRK